MLIRKKHVQLKCKYFKVAQKQGKFVNNVKFPKYLTALILIAWVQFLFFLSVCPTQDILFQEI